MLQGVEAHHQSMVPHGMLTSPNAIARVSIVFFILTSGGLATTISLGTDSHMLVPKHSIETIFAW